MTSTPGARKPQVGDVFTCLGVVPFEHVDFLVDCDGDALRWDPRIGEWRYSDPGFAGHSLNGDCFPYTVAVTLSRPREPREYPITKVYGGCDHPTC